MYIQNQSRNAFGPNRLNTWDTGTFAMYNNASRDYYTGSQSRLSGLGERSIRQSFESNDQYPPLTARMSSSYGGRLKGLPDIGVDPVVGVSYWYWAAAAAVAWYLVYR